MSASASNSIPSNDGRGKASLLPWLLLALVALVAFAWWAYETTDPVFGRFEGDAQLLALVHRDDVERRPIEDDVEPLPRRVGLHAKPVEPARFHRGARRRS